jgi:membrane protease subunit (stomatin/prohibitin family)
MATPALGMIEGGTVVHYMVHAALTRCGGWDASRQAVASVPPGCRMCKRCTRRDGLSLECGCDVTQAMLRKDGVTAFCYRCEHDVKIISDRERF